MRYPLPREGNKVSCIASRQNKTHPCHLSQTILNRLFGRVLEKEGQLGYYNNAECYPLPLREREELLCEQSELSNSGEGCKDLPSPVAFATQSPKCRKTRHFDKMLKQVQHDNFSCAEHTVTNLFTYLPIHLFTKIGWIASLTLTMTKPTPTLP